MGRTIWNWLNPLARSKAVRRTPKLRLGFDVLEGRLTPATIRVNNLGDTSGAGIVTLRDAISAANNDTTTQLGDTGSGNDSIVFTVAGNVVVLNGAYNITSTISIDGTGLGIGGTIFDSNTPNVVGRAFNFGAAGETFTLSNVTVSNFHPGIFNGGGGAILQFNGTMVLNNVTLSNNSAPEGGAILHVDGGMTLNSVVIRNNSTIAFDGGGIQQEGGDWSLNNVTIDRNSTTGNGGGLNWISGSGSYSGLTLSNNHADGNGGAFHIATGGVSTQFFTAASTGNSAGGSGGFLSIENNSATTFVAGSVINGNSAQLGGGIAVAFGSGLTLNSTTISANTATMNGGGVLANGGLTVNSSTFTGNTATVLGGAIAALLPNSLSITSSTIGGLTSASANRAAQGGGIAITLDPSVTGSIVQSAIANNSATTQGGGIYVGAGTTNIYNTTISSNAGPGGLWADGVGTRVNLVNDTIAFNGNGGVFQNNPAVVSSVNTIFSNNAGLDYVGAISSSGFNLFGTSAGVTSGFTFLDIVSSQANLGPLAFNGGPTLNHALAFGSRAINSGSVAAAHNVGLTVDQRGSNRYVGQVDIGSYEFIDTLPPTATFTSAPNINAASGAVSTTNVVVTYTDVPASGFSGTSGVDTSTFGIDDITVNNGAAVTGFSFSGNVVTYVVTSSGVAWNASPQGLYNVSLAANGVRDLSGNGIVGVIGFGSFFVDTVPPTITISGPSVATTVAGPVSFTVTYADANFSASTLSLANIHLVGTPTGTVSLTGSGTSYTITVSNIIGSGTLGISIDAGTASDTSGNLAPAGTSAATTTVTGNRILTLSQPAAPRTILPGSSYTYVITAGNVGNQTSPNAVVTVNVPAFGTFVPSTSTLGWTNTGGSQYQFSLGNLAVGAQVPLAFTVSFATKTPPGTTATVTATITDGNAGGSVLATSTVSSIIANPNRLRWGRCC